MTLLLRGVSLRLFRYQNGGRVMRPGDIYFITRIHCGGNMYQMVCLVNHLFTDNTDVNYINMQKQTNVLRVSGGLAHPCWSGGWDSENARHGMILEQVVFQSMFTPSPAAGVEWPKEETTRSAVSQCLRDDAPAPAAAKRAWWWWW